MTASACNMQRSLNNSGCINIIICLKIGHTYLQWSYRVTIRQMKLTLELTLLSILTVYNGNSKSVCKLGLSLFCSKIICYAAMIFCMKEKQQVPYNMGRAISFQPFQSTSRDPPPPPSRATICIRGASCVAKGFHCEC